MTSQPVQDLENYISYYGLTRNVLLDFTFNTFITFQPNTPFNIFELINTNISWQDMVLFSRESILKFYDIIRSLSQYEEVTPSKEEQIKLTKDLIQEHSIEVNNGKILDCLFNKLEEKDISSLREIMEYLIGKVNDNSIKRFSMELFRSYEEDLEELYFLLYFDPEITRGKTKDILLEIRNFVYDKYPSLCSFVGFARR